MITRYRAALNGKHLDAIDKNICILDIQYATPEYSVNMETAAGREGADIKERKRQKVSVTITFEVHIYNTATRNAVAQKIKTWANGGGTLTTNDREGQSLHNIVCDQLPEIESVKNWTDPVTMVLSAYQFPYWEDDDLTTLTISGTNTSGTLKLPGNAGNVNAIATITANAAVTWFEVTVASTKIYVTANVAKNDVVNINYSKGYLTIKNGSTSLLGKRSAASSDELQAASGKNNTVKLRASAKMTAKVQARGAWL